LKESRRRGWRHRIGNSPNRSADVRLSAVNVGAARTTATLMADPPPANLLSVSVECAGGRDGGVEDDLDGAVLLLLERLVRRRGVLEREPETVSLREVADEPFIMIKTAPARSSCRSSPRQG
jgi:hypothetical protein